jgi:hypothetical protein
VHQNFDAHVGKDADDQPRDVAVVLKEITRVAGDAFTMILGQQPIVGLHFGRPQPLAHIVLPTNEDELSRRAIVHIVQGSGASPAGSP